MDSPLFTLAFLSLFHIIGAIAVGSAIRHIWLLLRGDESGGLFQQFFFIVWGSLFGFIPFGFGTDPNLPGWFLGAQVAIWSTAFLLSLFIGRTAIDWAKPIMNVKVGLMLFGGLFMLGGILGGWGVFKGGDVGAAIAISLIFGGIGATIFLIGFLNLLKKS